MPLYNPSGAISRTMASAGRRPAAAATGTTPDMNVQGRMGAGAVSPAGAQATGNPLATAMRRSVAAALPPQPAAAPAPVMAEFKPPTAVANYNPAPEVKPRTAVASYQPGGNSGPVMAEFKPPTAVADYNPNPNPAPSPAKTDALTEAGRLKEEALLKELKGESPLLTSARAQTDRENLLRSSQSQRAAEESAAAAGFKPGSPEYQRAVDKALAGASSQNIDATNRVSDLGRSLHRDALQEAGRTETMSRTEAAAYINSIEDPKARQAAWNEFAQGRDPRASAGKMFDETGTLREGYRSETAPQADINSRKEELRLLNPTMSDEELTRKAVEEIRGERAAQNRPVETANRTAADADVQRTVETARNKGTALSAEDFQAGLQSGAIKNYTPSSLPFRDQASPGTTFAVNGEQYQSLKTARLFKSSSTHRDIVVAQKADGSIVYLNNVQGTGKSGDPGISPTPPYDAAKRQYAVWDPELKDTVWSTTPDLSGRVS